MHSNTCSHALCWLSSQWLQRFSQFNVFHFNLKLKYIKDVTNPDLSELEALSSTSCSASCCASLAMAGISVSLSSCPSRSFQTLLCSKKKKGLHGRWGFLFLPRPPSVLQREFLERQRRIWLQLLWIMQVSSRQKEVGFWACLAVHSGRKATPNPPLRRMPWSVLFGSLGGKPVFFHIWRGTTSTYGSYPERGCIDWNEEWKASWWGGSFICEEAMNKGIHTLEIKLKHPNS